VAAVTTEPELDVCVVGAGVAGLVIAAEAARAGARVLVLDRARTTGGLLRPAVVAGVALDAGAESYALRTDAVERLVADLALPLDRVAPEPGGAHLVLPGRLGALRRVPLPVGMVVGIPGDPLAPDVRAAIGEAGARRAAREAEIPAEAGGEPSLYALVRRRLGRAVADLLVDPICRSVYSRPAAEVRLSALHPGLWEAYRAHGSLTAAARAAASGARPGSAVGGIRGGMWRLADALRADAVRHGARIETGAVVTGVAAPSTVRVETAEGMRTLRARRVVIATGAGEARGLLGLGEPAGSANAASSVALCTVALVSPGWDAAPLGSGAIVAPRARSRAKALTHVDAKWAWAREALPPRTHVVRLSARSADAAWTEDPARVARELTRLSGVATGADAIRSLATTRWHDALAPAASAERDRLARRAADLGLAIAGAAVAGTGLASVIPHARAVARDLLPAAATRTAVPIPTREEPG
jgi:protoporphyrinogen/coproporphyrinogen III oxidase